jgi:REP element-mobilizing transposase RayT
MRQARIIVPPDMDGLYHVVSRVVDRRMIFGEEEKKKFRELLVSYAGFSGITVAAWCLMDNHFHLLLHVPSRERENPGKLSEKEILRRVAMIYPKAHLAEMGKILAMCGSAELRLAWLERYTRRMGDLSVFMKILKQRFTQWYNGKNRRKGTLWEDRFRSVAVEIQDLATLGAAARIVSAYIDLNPVRAGMVDDPAEYPWCGYARALVGEKESAKGLLRVWGKQRGLRRALAEYRVYLFEEGSEERVEDRSPPLTPALSPGKGRVGAGAGSVATQEGPASPDGYAGASKIQDRRTGEWKTRVGIDARKVWEERKRGGRLPMHVMLRLKSRYLVDGAAIGSAEFLRRLTGKSEMMPVDGQEVAEASGTSPESPPVGREGVAMRFGHWGGLRVLRDLRVNVVGQGQI